MRKSVVNFHKDFLPSKEFLSSTDLFPRQINSYISTTNPTMIGLRVELIGIIVVSSKEKKIASQKWVTAPSTGSLI